MEIISSHVFAQINIELIVFSSDLWWKITLEFYHYKLRVLLCYCMLGKEGSAGDLGKQFKILVKNVFGCELQVFYTWEMLLIGKLIKSTTCKS
jgi:hypothetical protein